MRSVGNLPFEDAGGDAGLELDLQAKRAGRHGGEGDLVERVPLHAGRGGGGDGFPGVAVLLHDHAAKGVRGFHGHDCGRIG